MRRLQVTMSAVLVLLAAAGARAQMTLQEEIKQLQQQRHKLEHEDRAQLLRKLEAVRNQARQSPQLQALASNLAIAKRNYEAKLSADPEILQAQQKLNQAEQHYRQVEAAAVRNSPAGQKIAAKREELKQQMAQAEYQMRFSRFIIEEIRRTVKNSPSVQKLHRQARQIDHQWRQIPGKDEEIQQARKDLDEARKRLDAKVKALPEYRAVKQAEARYNRIVNDNARLAEAKKRRDQAWKAVRDKENELVIADPQGGIEYAKYKEAEKALQDARSQWWKLDREQRSVTRHVQQKDADVIEARKLLDSARGKHWHTRQQQTADEAQRVKLAENAYEEGLKEKMRSDPRVEEITTELNRITTRMRQLDQRIRQLQEQAKAKR